MSYLEFDKSQLINLEYSLNKEILRTNRAGSYSLSTIIGCNTRKYHGLLVCPVDELDGDRHVLLSALDETIIQEDSEFNLGIRKYEGDMYIPKGHKYIRDFNIDNTARITYRVGNVVLIKELIMIDGEEQILIKYTLQESIKPVKLRFRPFLAFKNHHQLSKANLHAKTKSEVTKNGIKSQLYDGYPHLHMQFSKANEFVPTPDWYYNIEYMEELKRGYDYKEDLFVPGFFELDIKKGESIIFSASTFEAKPEGLKRKYTSQLSKRIERSDLKSCLINAAEQFFVTRNGKTDVIAGYPWFGSWGRDTFIALPGLSLAIDNIAECKAVLDSMVKKQSNGLFPNMGNDDNPAYNSVDAPMWFFWAVQQYNNVVKKPNEVWRDYGPTMKAVIENFTKGTSFNIRVDENGLIYAGEEGKALTWMDAVIYGNQAITPRAGYNVEINALWYNALMFALELAEKNRDTEFINQYIDLPGKVIQNFNELFYDRKKNYLADYIDYTHTDWSVRCNMVIATSLDYAPIDDDIIKAVLDKVHDELLTPRGLRTLSPKNEQYIGIYEGGQEKRDASYHQGTVWPWLLEHYARGYLKLYKESGVAHIQKIINGFEEVMNEYGIGTIAEIYDGNPPHKSRGAISQAWSVAALLNMIKLVEQYKK